MNSSDFYGRKLKLLRQKDPSLDGQFRSLTIKAAELGTPCQNSPDLWWDDDKRLQARAVEGCRECPLLQECFEWGINAQEQFGIWGGTTPTERSQLIRRKELDERKRKRKRPVVIPPPTDPAQEFRNRIKQERENAS